MFVVELTMVLKVVVELELDELTEETDETLEVEVEVLEVEVEAEVVEVEDREEEEEPDGVQPQGWRDSKSSEM